MVELEPVELKVNKVASKEVICSFVLGYAQKLDWACGKMDHELNWISSTESGTGVYVGELNGTKVTGISLAVHGTAFGLIGNYYCQEEHRGKGYGLKTWKTALAAVGRGISLCLDADRLMAPMYEQEGFKVVWHACVFKISSSCIFEAYSNIPIPNGVSVMSATEVNFAKLKQYIEEVIGFTFFCPDLLEKWITLPTHSALAAVDDNGNIVGFASFRERLNTKKDTHRISPLFADNGVLARVLLLKLASKVNPEQSFGIPMITALAGSNIHPETKLIADEVKGEILTDHLRMCNGSLPPFKADKCFGVFEGPIA